MLKKLYTTGAFLCFFMHPSYALSPVPMPVPLGQQPVQVIVEHFAAQYHVSAKKLLKTMNCESSLNIEAVGDHGHSFGLSQIYLPAHKNITQEQAKNPVFATEFMASNFAKGNAGMWTCARRFHFD